MEPSPIRVTVVDDEPYAQDILVRAARSWNYLPQAASSAEQALELLENQLTPIVVTDLRMPGRGGVWLIQEIRRRWPQTRIIVITAGHETDSASQCLEAGADHYFFKPIRLDEFRHALETACRTQFKDQQQRREKTELERQVARQTRKVRRTFLSAIDSLVRTMEERDAYTAGHSMRVRYYALELARAVDLNLTDQRRLALAAKLHDIGKIAVPDTILNKAGTLTAEERGIIQQHPVTGARILAPIVRSKKVLAAIRCHHERIDGRGYPDGLRGREIPVLARLISIPDCFDALTTSRAYRAALKVEDALRIIRDGAGSQLDAELAEVFIRLVPRLLTTVG
jgi:putative nucleotidyltransferase with HDIG domain